MQLMIYLLAFWIAHFTAFAVEYNIVPDETVTVVERKNIQFSATFGNGALDPKNHFYLNLTAPNGNEITIASGTIPNKPRYSLKVNKITGTYTATITNVSYDLHRGRYMFYTIGKSRYGTEFHQKKYIQLVVKAIPGGVILSPNGKVEAVEGEYLHSTCTSTRRFEGCMVAWMRHQGEDVNNLKAFKIENEHCSSSISLPVRHADHRMSIECRIINKHIKNRPYSSASLTVYEKFVPQVQIWPQHKLQLLEGEVQDVVCNASAHPPVKRTVWIFQHKVISTNQPIFRVIATPQSSGIYICEAMNEVGSRASFIFLEVQFSPKISRIPNQEAGEGETVTVVCNSFAIPPTLLYLWRREKDSSFEVKGPRLTLTNVTINMIDKYTCLAFNRIHSYGEDPFAGMAQTSFRLNIRHSPGTSIIQPSRVAELEGRIVKLTCKSEPQGHPKTSTRWMKFPTGEFIKKGDDLYLTVGKTQDQIVCEQYNNLGKSITSSPASIIPLHVDNRFADFLHVPYNETTGALQIDKINLTYPFTAKIDISWNNSMQYIDIMVNASQNITVPYPEYGANMRLFFCPEYEKTCLQPLIIDDSWTSDRNKNTDMCKEANESNETEQNSGKEKDENKDKRKRSWSIVDVLSALILSCIILFGIIVVAWMNANGCTEVQEVFPLHQILRNGEDAIELTVRQDKKEYAV